MNKRSNLRSLIFMVDAQALTGIYVYAAAIFILMLATMLMDTLARDGR